MSCGLSGLNLTQWNISCGARRKKEEEEDEEEDEEDERGREFSEMEQRGETEEDAHSKR